MESDNPRAGYDAVIQAESGFTYMNGEAEGNPLKMPVALMDILAAHQLKEAVLLALLSKRTGRGGAVYRGISVQVRSGFTGQPGNQLARGTMHSAGGWDLIIPISCPMELGIYNFRRKGDSACSRHGQAVCRTLHACWDNPELAVRSKISARISAGLPITLN
jgi:crotonobetainyl-CoA:carnitine CoA-transferase CaiB-like acyl-CoA transferase